MALTGRILDIDLSAGTWAFYPFPEGLVPKCMAGRGFNVWFMFHNMAPGIDPLGPDNILLLSCGLLTGTAAPASSRLHVNALSPLTGLLGSSNVGGEFGARLRSSAIQSLIIRGRAPKPVYVQIDGSRVVILDAEALWGLNTWETRERIKEEVGADAAETMVIGPGGENGALFSCLIVDDEHAAGRTGMGAVMGSKNLKAVVVTGRKHKIPLPSESGREAIRHYVGQIKSSPHFDTLKRYGGAGYIKWADEMGILAAYNYGSNHFREVDALDVRRLENHKMKSRGCHRCPVRCKAEFHFRQGMSNESRAIRPEFEPMVSLGSKCGLSDLEALIYLDNLCSRLGLDSISAGSAIAFAMDLYARGILIPRDTEGLDLTWGNSAAMETLIRQMAHREGLGAILSQGVRRAAEIIGRGSEEFAFHVKGLELSAYHPYYIMGTALGYAVANRGGDFNDVYASLEYLWSPEKATQEFGTPLAVDLNTIHGKAPLVKRAMIVNVVLDSLGLCKVPALSLIGTFDLENEAELTAALTGCPVDGEHLMCIGERIVTLERLINLRQGATYREDRLPEGFFQHDRAPWTNSLGASDWLTSMVMQFYRIMGWNQQGQPRQEKIEALGLDRDVAESAAPMKREG